MSKRKHIETNANENTEEKRAAKRPKIKLEDAPPVNDIKDLIAIGKTLKFYKNVDVVTLWEVLPYLEELEAMIGMKSVKETVFYQVIYYLQKMHSRNKNEEYLHSIITGKPGTGKCLGFNTPILMANGCIKMVQDIQVGDVLMGDDLTYRNVLSVTSGREKMFKIKQSRGEDYIVNESHILSLKVSSDTFFHNNKEYKSEDIIDIPISEYLSLEDNMKIDLKGFRVKTDYNNNYTYKDIEMNPFSYGNFLGQAIKNGGSILSIPGGIKYNNSLIRLQFLLGILKNFTKDNDDYYRFSYDNVEILKDIVGVSRSLGLYTYISGKYINIHYLCNNDSLKSDIEIEELDVGNYYGFTIDGNHRFLLGDHTVTHNTTVAKIIGKIYTNLGVLSKKNNVFKIGYRDDFVAEYLGQTAIKTRKFLESCLGGVLFIDEVYSLGPGQKDKDSFSKEAIDTLCSFLSEHKNDFCCIVAGYKDEIKKCFLSVNQGLERRFPWVHNIGEYTDEDIAKIFLKMLNETKWELKTDINNEYLVNMFKNNKEMFKHTGGSIETFITKMKMCHSKRVFSLDRDVKFIITKQDIENTIEETKKHLEPKEKIRLEYYT